MKEQKERCAGSLSVRRIKRQYVWAKSGGPAGTAERSYTPLRKPTRSSKRNSSLQPITYILESMAVEVARTTCRPASTVIRTRVHGVSKNFGSGCEPEHLHSTIKYWSAGRSTTERSFSISSLPGFANSRTTEVWPAPSIPRWSSCRDELRFGFAALPDTSAKSGTGVS